MKRCSRCGEQNDDGVRYCGTCGLPVPNSAGSESTEAHVPGPTEESAPGTGPEPNGTQSTEYVDAPSFGETRTVAAPPPSVATGSATVASPVDATSLGAPSTSSEAPPSGPPPGRFAAGATTPAPVPELRSTRSTSLVIAALAVAVVVIIGGVFVLLASGSGEDDVARPGQDSVASDTAIPDAPTPSPVPSGVPSADSLPADTSPAPTAGPSEPAVTVAPAVPLRAPGDLALKQPILDEACDGRYITFVGSAVGDRPYNVVVSELLDLYPGANYIWTRACPSLRQQFTGGADIYGVVFGPFATEQEACDARAFGPQDAYVRRISTLDPQDHTIDC